jgi:hypothetical protein
VAVLVLAAGKDFHAEIGRGRCGLKLRPQVRLDRQLADAGDLALQLLDAARGGAAAHQAVALRR